MITQLKTYHEISAVAADKIIQLVQQNKKAVLCLAGGDTPSLTYDMIVAKARQQEVDFSGVSFIGLDEWVGIKREMPGSCYHFLQHKIFAPLNIQPEQIHFFDAMANNLQQECDRINETVRQFGGIDLALVGIGLNGHIGFNEPGIDPSLHAHVVDLDAVTTSTGQKYFTSNTALGKGISLGMAQIMNAGEVILIASGRKKADIIRKTVREDISATVPASLLMAHPRGVILLDDEAAAEL